MWLVHYICEADALFSYYPDCAVNYNYVFTCYYFLEIISHTKNSAKPGSNQIGCTIGSDNGDIKSLLFVV